MMDFQELLVTLDLVVILEKMVQRGKQDYQGLSGPLVIEDLLDHLVPEGFKVCLVPQENLVKQVKMEKTGFLVSQV